MKIDKFLLLVTCIPQTEIQAPTNDDYHTQWKLDYKNVQCLENRQDPGPFLGHTGVTPSSNRKFGDRSPCSVGSKLRVCFPTGPSHVAGYTSRFLYKEDAYKLDFLALIRLCVYSRTGFEQIQWPPASYRAELPEDGPCSMIIIDWLFKILASC